MRFIFLCILKLSFSSNRINMYDAFLKLPQKFTEENKELINATILTTYHHLHAILLLCINYINPISLYNPPLSFKFEIFNCTEYGKCLKNLNKMVNFSYNNNIKLNPILYNLDSIEIFFDSINPSSKVPRNYTYEMQLITTSSVILTEFLLNKIKQIPNSLDRLILSQFVFTIFSTPSNLCFFYLVRAMILIKKNYFLKDYNDKILELFKCIAPNFEENLLVTEIKYLIAKLLNSEKKMNDFKNICDLLGFVFPFVFRNIILMEPIPTDKPNELNFVYTAMTDIVYKVIQ